MNRYAFTMCLAISFFSFYFGLTSYSSANIPEHHYSSVQGITTKYEIEEFNGSKKHDGNKYYELALYTENNYRFYLRKPNRDELTQYDGKIISGDIVTVFFDEHDGNIIKSIYKDNVPIVSYNDTILNHKNKASTLLTAGTISLLIAILFFVIRKKISFGAILFLLSGLILMVVAVTGVLDLYKSGNTSFEEYIKSSMIFLFGLISFYSFIISINPDFKLLKSVFRLSPEQSSKVIERSGFYIIAFFLFFFTLSFMNALTTHEVYYFFSNANSGWISYNKSPSLYYYGLGQTLFGIITFVAILIWRLRSRKGVRESSEEK